MFKVIAAALTLTTLLAACSPSEESSEPSNQYTPPDLSNLHSYKADSHYAEALRICPTLYQQNKECRIRELPPLSVDSAVISTDAELIDEIMDRVVVSHDWMGDNFRLALELLPRELLSLTSPLAAIVIDDDIRPSFFLHTSGMIYLDPKYLWLTDQQKADVSDVEDYRSANRAQMTTLPAWRYVQNNDYAYASSYASSRTEADMAYALARLLAHELAHANDFIELGRLPSINQESGFSALINSDGGQLSKNVMATVSPLISQTLLDYTAALYKSETASMATQNLTGSSAGLHMASEGANAVYSYTTRYEDFAMLIEESMMAKFFGFQRDSAFVQEEFEENDAEGNPVYSPFVKWGVRGRISDPLVKPRAQKAIALLLPESETNGWTAFFNSLAAPSSMAYDATWLDNLDLIAGTSSDAFLVEDAANRDTAPYPGDFGDPHH